MSSGRHDDRARGAQPRGAQAGGEQAGGAEAPGGTPDEMRDEMLAMAYADGELDGASRAEFEARLAREPDLARLVARERRLAVLAREFAPPEPLEIEWQRLARTPAQRAGSGAGWTLLLLGLGALGGAAVHALWTSGLGLLARFGISAAVLGILVLLAITLHNRLRTRHLDPYAHVKR